MSSLRSLIAWRRFLQLADSTHAGWAGQQDVTIMLCQPAIRSLTVLAPAKLNLFLRILRKREDGFHELETVMTAIDLFDTLQFTASESAEITFRVAMASDRRVNSSPSEVIPSDSNNLVLRAARLLREYASVNFGARITLVKRIPSCAGMGGGSSDAAATLAGLNRLWNLKLHREELLDIAAKLGSDIGFFLAGSSSAICRGRGEIVQPLQLPHSLYFVIAKPKSGLSTPLVFKHCRPGESQQSCEELVQTMKQPGTCRMVRLLLNDLQAPAESLNEDVRSLRAQFSKLPVLGHQMSGSGTSYFGICSSARHARMVAARLKATGIPWVHVARSCP